MKIILELSIVVFLVFIIFQDFKSRAIYWFLCPLVFISALIYTYFEFHFFYLKDLLTSTSFLVLQFLLASIYFSIKNRKLINITNSQIGLGDLLFLLSITPLFSISNYIIFYTASLLFSMLFYFFYLLLDKTNRTIPLAGLQAIILLALLFILKFEGKISLLKSDFLLYSLYK
jgi:hypothetical protein